MPRRKRIARVAAVGGSVSALVAAATGISPGPAVAQDLPIVHVNNVVLRPSDGGWWANAAMSGPTLDGTMVYAFATKPLTGPAGDGAGLPAGLTFGTQKICKPAPQVTAVYLCRVGGDRDHSAPVVTVPADTSHDTMGYYGAVYAPAGSDLTAAVQAAQTAGATPADRTHGAGTFTVKRPEHVAQNTLALSRPDSTNRAHRHTR